MAIKKARKARQPDELAGRQAPIKKHKGKVGKPTIFTDDISKTICNGVMRGLYRKRAAALAGVGERTMQDWIRKAVDDPDKYPIYVQFVYDLEQAEAMFVDTNIKQIKTAASKGDWKAAAWLAERRRPLEYGKTEKRINEGDATPTQSSFDERIDKWKAMMIKLNEDANVE